MRLSYAFVFLFLFSINIYASDLNTNAGIITLPADFSNVAGAGAIGVTIGILLAALAYMIGNFFNFPQMIGWSKNQLWESVYTLILVATVLIFTITIHIFPIGVPDALASNSQISFPEKAALSIDNVINGEIELADLPDTVKEELTKNKYITTDKMGIKSLFFTSYGYQLGLGSIYNIVSINFLTLGNYGSTQATGTTSTTGSINFEGQLLTGLKKLMGLSGIISNYLLSLLMMLYVQIAALIFIASGSIFLFMFGVFFRCLPVTRKLGSTLIALFITLYFIYPAFVIFIYSDGMYGAMSKEFSGAYTSANWFEDMSSFDPNGLTFTTPYGLTQVNTTSFGKGNVILRFSSNMFSEYNYTITKGYRAFTNQPDLNKLISTESNILCSGTAKNGEIVECDLSGSLPSNYNLFDPNTELKDESSIEKAEIEPVNYYVQLKANSADYLVETDELKYGIATYPEEPVPFPVFYSKQCENSDRCNQIVSQISISLEKEASDFVNEILLGTIAEESVLDMISKEGTVSDGVVIAAKTYGTVKLQKNLAQVSQNLIQKGSRSLLKKGLPKWGVKLGLGAISSPLAIASFILRSAMFKNDVSSFIYDEMTCDYYTTAVAKEKFGDNTFPEPEFSETSIEHIFSSAGKFLSNVGSETYDSTFKYYSESDYTSCSGSLGIINSGLSGFASLFSDEDVKLREFHVTTIFAPIVYVFIAFIYTIIFSVTFFRSVSESIGGDSSLMGLSKII